MSNELNVEELVHGTIDPGVELTFYFWGEPGTFETQRKRARFFTIAPDPLLERLELGGAHSDLQINRTWNTVWSGTEFAQNGQFEHVFQSNVVIENVGPNATGFRLIQAETDN